MGTAQRAYDILRGYVNREWDRISGGESTSAQRELDEAMATAPLPPTPAESTQSTPPQTMQDRARSILGLAPEAAFGEIRKAFERLNKRSDPRNFPPGSVEAIKAAEIQKQIHWAYGTLTEGMDNTEKRFRSLEIE
jgi:hypothetical protein